MGNRRRPRAAPVDTARSLHADATALLKAARAGDQRRLRQVAMRAAGSHDAEALASLLTRVAWGAGCYASRLPAGLAEQITHELAQAPALVALATGRKETNPCRR